MDLLSSLRVSASGLAAETTRLNTIASNIANAETPGYKRKDAVFQATVDRQHFGEILKDKLDHQIQGVQVAEIQEDPNPPRLEYNPKHHMARPDGYVEMPNINPVLESANMISATRAYEANITAINAAKAMAMKALEIGK